MADNRLKEVHTTDLIESRVNEDFVDWLKSKGPQYLLFALIGVCIYLGVVRWKQYKTTYFNNAWTEFEACRLPGAFEDVADRYSDLPGLAQQATRAAADTWLNAVQTGKPLGSEGTDATAQAVTLTDQQRAEYLDQAWRLYQALVNDDDDSLADTLYAVSAMQGLAVVAECKGDTDKVKLWFNKAAARAETSYPDLAKRIRERAATAGAYAEPVTLPTQAQLPKPVTPKTLEPATIAEPLRELLLPDEPDAG